MARVAPVATRSSNGRRVWPAVAIVVLAFVVIGIPGGSLPSPFTTTTPPEAPVSSLAAVTPTPSACPATASSCAAGRAASPPNTDGRTSVLPQQQRDSNAGNVGNERSSSGRDGVPRGQPSAFTVPFLGAPKGPFVEPAGWRAPGCGLGPPPPVTDEMVDRALAASRSIDDPGPSCEGFLRRYQQQCGAAKNGAGSAYTGRFQALCVLGDGQRGQPVHVLVGSVAAPTADAATATLTCGPPAGTMAVLDVRVDGPRSVEYVSMSRTSHRWLQWASFRPMDPGAYTMLVRAHWDRVPLNNSWNFGAGQNCPTKGCREFTCAASPPYTVQVQPGVCPKPDLPTCSDAGYPTREEHWFGRWYLECSGRRGTGFANDSSPGADCGGSRGHPVETRTLDGAKRKLAKNLMLLRSIGGCGPTEPQTATQIISTDVFSEPSGWVWRPHACRPRVFTPEAAWGCLNNTGLLTIGDSVSFTNSHLLWIWLRLEKAPFEDYMTFDKSTGASLLRPRTFDQRDVDAPSVTIPRAPASKSGKRSAAPEAQFSQRGKRHDEHHRLVRPWSPPSVRGASFYYNGLGRSHVSHLPGLSRHADALVENSTAAEKERWGTVAAALVSMGLHDATTARSHPTYEEFEQNLREGFANFKLPLIYQPSSGSSVRKHCEPKNSYRAELTNNVTTAALHHLSVEERSIPPVAIQPSFYMARSVAWEAASFDGAGTHPFCSFVGLSMWMQTLDLVCPIRPSAGVRPSPS